jgi:hypothetical protein
MPFIVVSPTRVPSAGVSLGIDPLLAAVARRRTRRGAGFASAFGLVSVGGALSFIGEASVGLDLLRLPAGRPRRLLTGDEAISSITF